MFNPIYFSDYIRPAIKKIRFVFIVLGRFLKILFSRDKRLILQELEYQRKYQFNESLLIIQYQFKNVLWYCFKGIRRTTDAGVIVLNVMDISTKPITLIVHGFFRKKNLMIDIIPEARLQTSSFQTKISKPCNLQSNLSPVAISQFVFKPDLPKIQVYGSTIRKSSNNILVVYPSFNQTEFL